MLSLWSRTHRWAQDTMHNENAMLPPYETLTATFVTFNGIVYRDEIENELKTTCIWSYIYTNTPHTHLHTHTTEQHSNENKKNHIWMHLSVPTRPTHTK